MPCSGCLSVSRAYYAMYQEAQFALEAVGLVRTEFKQHEGPDNRPRMNEGGGSYGISQPAAGAVGRWSAL